MKKSSIISEYYCKFGDTIIYNIDEFIENNQEKFSLETNKNIAIYHNEMHSGGGISRVISLLIPLYLKMGINVILITEEMSKLDKYIPKEVKRYIIAKVENNNDYKVRAEQLEKILMDNEVSIFIHHCLIPRCVYQLYDILLAKLLKVKVIVEKHQVFSEEITRMENNFFYFLKLFKVLDKLVVLSEVETTLWKTFGINACYIENPYNENLKLLKKESKDEYVVWIGRLSQREKKYLDVLEIAKRVITNKPNSVFFIYGSGTNNIVNDLKERIRINCLSKNVIYCGYNPDVNQIYQNARIHLVTSEYEAFPMGIYESRICGIPLVMYELPYLELLKSGKGYLASKHGDYDDMAKNICRILDDPLLEKKLSIEAKESIQGFNNDVVSQKWKNLFDELEKEPKAILENRDYALILKTINHHFEVAQKKYYDLKNTLLRERVLTPVKFAIGNQKKIAIGPIGKIGQQVLEILNENNIVADYLVDNKPFNQREDVISVEQLKKENCENVFFIVCTVKKEIQNLYCSQLKGYIAQNDIYVYENYE